MINTDWLFWAYTFAQFFKLGASLFCVVMLVTWWNQARKDAEGWLIYFLLTVGLLLVALANRDIEWSIRRLTDLGFVVAQIHISGPNGGYAGYARGEGFIAGALAILTLPIWLTKGFRLWTYAAVILAIGLFATAMCVEHRRALVEHCSVDTHACAEPRLGSRPGAEP